MLSNIACACCDTCLVSCICCHTSCVCHPLALAGFSGSTTCNTPDGSRKLLRHYVRCMEDSSVCGACRIVAPPVRHPLFLPILLAGRPAKRRSCTLSTARWSPPARNSALQLCADDHLLRSAPLSTTRPSRLGQVLLQKMFNDMLETASFAVFLCCASSATPPFPQARPTDQTTSGLEGDQDRCTDRTCGTGDITRLCSICVLFAVTGVSRQQLVSRVCTPCCHSGIMLCLAGCPRAGGHRVSRRWRRRGRARQSMRCDGETDVMERRHA